MDYYEILGISSNSSPEELRKAYISASLTYHPDRNPSADAKTKFQEIANAYSILSDPLKRKDYDFSKKIGSNVDPMQLFTSIFDDLLIPEVPNPVYYWQPIGNNPNIKLRSNCWDYFRIYNFQYSWSNLWVLFRISFR